MQPLISTAELAERLSEPELAIVDIRWKHQDPEYGRRVFRQSHIPGAIVLDLDNDLSDRSDLTRGRHPLPDPQVFVQRLAKVGIGASSRVGV